MIDSSQTYFVPANAARQSAAAFAYGGAFRAASCGAINVIRRNPERICEFLAQKDGEDELPNDCCSTTRQGVS